MSRDSSFTYLHLAASHHADHLEDFCKPRLPVQEIVVPEVHKPIDPDDEDDVSPDQRAAFGIQRATQKTREPVWKDINLGQLLTGGPSQTDANHSSSASTITGSSAVPKPLR